MRGSKVQRSSTRKQDEAASLSSDPGRRNCASQKVPAMPVRNIGTQCELGRI